MKMDSHSLIEAMLKDCKKFEDKEISVGELQNSLETYGSLLEGVGIPFRSTGATHRSTKAPLSKGGWGDNL
jgi:hypothetical protein